VGEGENEKLCVAVLIIMGLKGIVVEDSRAFFIASFEEIMC